MDLFDYFEMKKREMINLKDLSQKIGCSFSYMRLIASRNTIPSFELCEEIERQTSGLISALDLYRNTRKAAIDKSIEREKSPVRVGKYKRRVMRKQNKPVEPTSPATPEIQEKYTQDAPAEGL